MDSSIKICLKEAPSRACLDVRMQFLNVDTVIDSFLHSQRLDALSAVASFQAAANKLYLVMAKDGYVVGERNGNLDPESLDGIDLIEKVESKIKQIRLGIAA